MNINIEHQESLHAHNAVVHTHWKRVLMLRKNPSGHSPVISEKAYIDPTAIICGKVIVEDYVYIGPYAVIRADELNEEGICHR